MIDAYCNVPSLAIPAYAEVSLSCVLSFRRMPESHTLSLVIPAYAGISPSDIHKIPGHARDDRERDLS
jgi:hypothetical protein